MKNVLERCHCGSERSDGEESCSEDKDHTRFLVACGSSEGQLAGVFQEAAKKSLRRTPEF
jgi:hypothetical protein